MSYIVIGKDNQQSSSDEYPLHLVYERDRLTGKAYGWQYKKKGAVAHKFSTSTEAANAAHMASERLKARWNGSKSIVFCVKPA